ncbi:MAG: hypothetical protein R2752_19585 [Vicinamibacterales bacterium]
MSFDPLSLFLSLVAGLVGTALLIYGKKAGRWPQMVGGLLFILYPYFIDTPAGILGIGALLTAALWWAVRMDL